MLFFSRSLLFPLSLSFSLFCEFDLALTIFESIDSLLLCLATLVLVLVFLSAFVSEPLTFFAAVNSFDTLVVFRDSPSAAFVAFGSFFWVALCLPLFTSATASVLSIFRSIAFAMAIKNSFVLSASNPATIFDGLALTSCFVAISNGIE